MTKFDYIKSLTIEELASELCQMMDRLDVMCEQCPAYKYCYKGHNGMKHWLNTNIEENKRQDGGGDIDAVSVRFIIDWLNKGGEDKISSCLKEWEKDNESNTCD